MNLKSIKNNYRSLKASQKKGAGTPAYTRFVNRFLGRVIASCLAGSNISPNAVSIISALFTYSAFILFLIIPSISFLHSLVLVMFLFFGYALDSADGQLARLQKKQSKQGEWLDHTLDAFKIPLSHAVAIFYIYTHAGLTTKTLLIFYLLIISLASANFLSGILKSKLIDKKANVNNSNSEKASIVRSFITLPLDYGTFIILFIFTFNVKLFTHIYYIWGIIFILYSILLLLKSWNELRPQKS